MKITAYSILAFYVCLNLSLYLVGEFQVVPSELTPAYSSPEAIQGKLIAGFFSAAITWGLTSAIVGSLLYGGIAGLLVFCLQFFMGSDSILYWALYGVPAFIEQMSTSAAISAAQVGILTGILVGLFSVVWLWFLLGLVSGRYMET